MITVNLFDGTFAHSKGENGFLTSTKDRKPEEINYVERHMDYDGVTVFCDEYMYGELPNKVKSKYKVAWCLESPAVKPYISASLHGIADKFDYVITFREDLIKSNPKKYLPAIVGGTWIAEKDHSLYSNEKTKKCSLLLSSKVFTSGQSFRHQIAHSVAGIDTFGGGSKTGHIKDKLDALKNYKYSFIIENCQHYNYFTEKLIDCLVTGTIPIYYGCPNIQDHFNTKGFVIINSLQDLQNTKLTNAKYEEIKPFIEENFNKAKNYLSSDDNLAKIIKQHIL